MGRSRRRLAATLAAVLAPWWAVAAPGPGTQPAAVDELPPEVLADLATVRDYTLDFGQPGFYALLEFVHDQHAVAGRLVDPIDAGDLRMLIERPADYRGRPVTVAGRVGRNSSWQRRADPGGQALRVWQLELTVPRAPVACTVILTEPADDIPIGATVRVTGYFVMMRSYYDRARRLRQAALIVATGPTLVATSTPRSGATPGWLTTAVIVATMLLVLAWVLLRARANRRQAIDTGLRPPKPAPFSVADDLKAWAEESADDTDDTDS